MTRLPGVVDDQAYDIDGMPVPPWWFSPGRSKSVSVPSLHRSKHNSPGHSYGMVKKHVRDNNTKVPTTFDETVPMDGKVGEYVALARRKGDTWYVGAMSNWDARDLALNLSFLSEGAYVAEVFQDGINADRDATDYKREVIKTAAGDTLKIHLAPGGGWAARIEKVK